MKLLPPTEMEHQSLDALWFAPLQLTTVFAPGGALHYKAHSHRMVYFWTFSWCNWGAISQISQSVKLCRTCRANLRPQLQRVKMHRWTFRDQMVAYVEKQSETLKWDDSVFKVAPYCSVRLAQLRHFFSVHSSSSRGMCHSSGESTLE